jgi:2-aminoadipate transaminase
MNNLFSDRITDVPRSFIREILKVAIDPSVISFAGGLPNRDLFPVQELQAATNKVFECAGKDALQYSNSEGYIGLREFIAERYARKQGLKISPENILITTGSQQGLDLLAKTLLNEGDDVVIEEPGYLGAIQSFSVYRAAFNPVPVGDDGVDVARLEKVLAAKSPKLMYGVPNFQNPAGVCWSDANRAAAARVMAGKRIFFVEDDPYGDLRFSGNARKSMKSVLPEQTILLGSFSKTVAPSFRLGWIVAPDYLMEKLVVAKQASDLHTCYFVQRILCQYLADNDFEGHIAKIVASYGRQCHAMMENIAEHFPKAVQWTRPEGGMFLWVCLPEGASALRLFDLAIKDKVAFVPGKPFYVNRADTNTLRLNFSCVDEKTIAVGIERLGKAIKQLLGG